MKKGLLLAMVVLATIMALIEIGVFTPKQKLAHTEAVGNDYRTPSGCGYGSKSEAFTAMRNMYIGPDEVLTSYSFYVENGKWCFRMLIECMP